MKKPAILLAILLVSLLSKAKIYIITLPYTTLGEILGESRVADFIANSAVSLLNAQTARFGNLASAYATVGAGARAYGLEEVVLYKLDDLYDDKELKANEVYKQRTGASLAGNEMVLADIEALVKINQERYYEIIPGFLSSILGLKGKTTSYIGNAGTLDKQKNPGALSVINRQGIVSEGENREVLKENPDKPFGVEADMERILTLALETVSELVLIEPGDLDRCEEDRYFLSEQIYLNHRQAALKKIGTFLFQLQSQIKAVDQIMLLGPLPSIVARNRGYGLGFLVIYPQNLPADFLYSPTTRKKGLVTLTDLAPTIEAYFAIENYFHSGGSLITKVPKNSLTLNTLLEAEKVSAIIKKLRPVFIKLYITLLIATIGLSFLCLGIFKNINWIHFLQTLLFAEACTPLLLLIVGLIPAKNYLAAFILAIVLSILGGFFSSKSRYRFWPALVTVGPVILALDLFFKARLIPRSVFGYDFQAGARFYGLGNEYMGYLAGLILLAAYFLGLVLGKKKLTMILLGLTVILVAFPHLGANVGGGLTMVIVFLAWLKLGMKKKIASPLLLLLPLFFALWVLIDYLRGDSHLIRTLLAIKDEGSVVIYNVLRRKISTNLKLWQWSLWSRGLIAFIAGLIWLVYKPFESLNLYLTPVKELKKLLNLTTITALAAVLLNDSGVVAGALVFLVPGCFILSNLLESLKSGT